MSIHRNATTNRRRNATKLIASVALVAGAASVAGLGTFGSFTSSTEASQAVASGKVTISNTIPAVQGLTMAATNMVPGDNAQRAITLVRAADSETFGSVKLTTSATTSSLLNTDTANGLQLTVDQCSVAWAKAANTRDLTCSGTTTTVIASRPVIGSAVDLGAATTTLNSADKASNLRFTLTLPTGANNDFQGLNSTVKFVFDATQRAAEAR